MYFRLNSLYFSRNLYVEAILGLILGLIGGISFSLFFDVYLSLLSDLL